MLVVIYQDHSGIDWEEDMTLEYTQENTILFQVDSIRVENMGDHRRFDLYRGDKLLRAIDEDDYVVLDILAGGELPHCNDLPERYIAEFIPKRPAWESNRDEFDKLIVAGKKIEPFLQQLGINRTRQLLRALSSPEAWARFQRDVKASLDQTAEVAAMRKEP